MSWGHYIQLQGVKLVIIFAKNGKSIQGGKIK